MAFTVSVYRIANRPEATLLHRKSTRSSYTDISLYPNYVYGIFTHNPLSIIVEIKKIFVSNHFLFISLISDSDDLSVKYFSSGRKITIYRYYLFINNASVISKRLIVLRGHS